jgi:LuxR family transcriptional regulator, maltose regulon positive regulatory protein
VSDDWAIFKATMRARAGKKRATPSRSNRIVRRARVVTAIGHALRNGICWIAAPAGYGKTTAMLDYLQKKPVPHVWHRVEEGDQDVATFFHHIGNLLQPASAARELPVFGPEYADQPAEFARRFFKAYFEKLTRANLLVIDDLHYAVEVPQFRSMLAIMLRELPDSLQCACISRTLPPEELTELTFKGRLAVLDQSILQFSDSEARALVASRVRKRSTTVDVSAARGWAAGLVLLADRASAGDLRAEVTRTQNTRDGGTAVFNVLARELFAALTAEEQEAMLKVSLLPEITPDLVKDLTGSEAARNLLIRLHQRQLLVSRGEARSVYFLHDLLRDFLQSRLAHHFEAHELAALREKAATRLHAAGYPDAAIDLALQAQKWPLARSLIIERAEALIAQGRRATLIDWCNLLPDAERDAWVCYWLGVANMADDATAEGWLARAWSSFTAQNELDGQCLTAARAVLSKSDSWRTHEGLAAWTQRVIDLIDRDFPLLSDGDQLLAWTGMLRAVDFAQDYRSDAPAVRRLTLRLLERLAVRTSADTANLRLMASMVLIDHAGSTGKAEIFERAVDSVLADLAASDVAPWVRGGWLVNFGSVTSRYFSYAKRGFPYTSPEQALRAAVAIGEREGLRGVEFGALYHLQLLMKMRNDWSEFATVIGRIAEISDSRYTTQVAVAADCEAALHTRHKRFATAFRACDRFMAAIEAANEPPIERWPHFITKFQVLLAAGKPDEAAAFLNDLIGLFDGAVRQRTQVCVLAANAFAAKWQGSGDYASALRTFLAELRASTWTAVLINLPEHLAELCADGLALRIEPELCTTLIRRRALAPPESRPALWPWPLRIFVLGEFRLELEGVAVNAGAKTPTRSLDILRVLAISKDHTCSLQDLHEWLWPDADGDQAKAACEQALHRLRKSLSVPDLIAQREGKLYLAPGKVWVDLEDWERSLTLALRESNAERSMQKVLDDFRGPLFHLERVASWALPATERVRSKFIDLVGRLARNREASGNPSAARAAYLRAIDMYPTSARCYEGLIRNRLAERDEAGALEDYQRYLRVMQSAEAAPSPGIRALVGSLLR